MIYLSDREPTLMEYEHLLLSIMKPTERPIIKSVVLGFGFNDLDCMASHVIEYDEDYNKILRMYEYKYNKSDDLYRRVKQPCEVFSNIDGVTNIRLGFQLHLMVEKMYDIKKQIRITDQIDKACTAGYLRDRNINIDSLPQLDWRLTIRGRV